MSAASLWIACSALTPNSTLRGDEPKPDDGYRQYSLDASLFSLRPGEEMASYRGYGGGVFTGPNATLGFGVADHGRRFEVSVSGKLKANRFSAVVQIEPEKEDTRTRPETKEYDLTDLQPKSLELARDDDGRVYRLNLSPRIQVSPQPKPFNVRDLDLEAFSFSPSSPVIVDDQDYVGELSASRGPIAQFEVPGLAKVEFSLLHLKNATPIGTLEDGAINIVHPNGTTVRISNVKNGAHQETLAGGPYRVWVRWEKPRESVEEYQKSLKSTISELSEQAKKGENRFPPGALERLERISKTGRAQIMEFEVRAAEQSDLAEPNERP
jgi:hypothetical protein